MVDIRLLGVPVEIQVRASEHNDGLRREFQMLVKQGEAEESSVPGRLIALATQLDERFQSFTAGARARLASAAMQGDSSIDLTLNIPPEVGPVAAEFKELMRQADQYCARGKHLLTLAPDREIVVFRNWVLDELTGQCEGREAVPWIRYAEQEGLTS